MKNTIKQTFNPAIRIHTGKGKGKGKGKEKREIKLRIWNMNENAVVSQDRTQEMGYMGQYQIEEVWKKYTNRGYYVSNLGYVIKLDKNNSEVNKLFFENNSIDLSAKDGFKFNDLNSNQKQYFRKNNEQPTFTPNEKIQVELRVYGMGPIHIAVAELFLEKPDREENLAVHHIDNNSYNNSVTNLIYLPQKLHSYEHDKFHPMSH